MKEKRNRKVRLQRKSQSRPGLFSPFLSYFMLLSWMAVIFFFSSLSGKPTDGPPPTWYFLERKGAHVIEYAVLLVLSFHYFSLTFFRERFGRILLLSAGFALMYATTDELHQFFVPFRGAKVTDVLIDGGGILLATLGIVLWRQIRKNRS